MSLGPFRICIFAREGCAEMRGKRSSGCWGIASEFDTSVDGRCISYLGRRVGRVEEIMLRCLGIWLAGV